MGNDIRGDLATLKKMVGDLHTSLIASNGDPVTALQLSTQPTIRQLLDNMPAWLWQTDASGVFRFISEQFERETSLSPSLWIGKTRKEIIASSPVHPSTIIQHNEAIMNLQKLKNFEYTVQLADGTMYWFNTSGWPVRDKSEKYIGYMGIGRDITVDKNRLLTMEKQTELLASSLNFLEISVLLLDNDQRIYFYNDHWKNLHVDMPAEDRTKGITYEQYLSSAIDYGLFPEAIGRKDEFMQERIHRNLNPPDKPFNVRRQSGILLSIRVSSIPGRLTAIISTQIKGPKLQELNQQSSSRQS
jgi:two-component system, cell cycle sensor histidine kinase PleC